MASIRYAVPSALALVALNGLALAGPLTPPAGPVAPTYKTLSEVEPRIVVNATNTPGNATSTYVISQPGSYYLDRNLTGEVGKVGIRITSGNVTLDLNGFVLQGSTGALDGIVFNGGSYVRIRNGVIRNWPGNGVAFGAGAAFNTVIEDVITESNTGRGLSLRDGVDVRRVKAEFNTGGGVRLASFARMSDSTIRGNGGAAVELFDGAAIDRCYIDSSGAATIGVAIGSTFPLGCGVRDCTFSISGGADAIVASGPNHVIENNSILGQNTPNSSGIVVQAGSTGVTVRNNIVKNTADNYNLAPGGSNQYDLLLSQIPETIDVTANVTLTGSLNLPAGSTAFALVVSADDVSIDFAGHTITGTSTSGNGVHINGAFRNLHVANGSVRGFNAGIVINDGAGAAGSDSVIENMRVLNNRREGIMGGNASRVLNCTVTQNGSAAIPTLSVGDGAIIEGCNLAGNTNTGATILAGSGCVISGNTIASNSGSGIQAANSCNITRNTVYNNGGLGITANVGNTIANNTVRQNQFEGVVLTTSNTCVENTLDFNGRASGNQSNITATGTANRIERNSLLASDFGLFVSGSRNFVAGNLASSNTTNFSIAPGNSFGPLVVVVGSGNFSAVGNSTHPQANFEY